METPSLNEVPGYDDAAEALAEFGDGPPTLEIPHFESMEEIVSERLR